MLLNSFTFKLNELKNELEKLKTVNSQIQWPIKLNDNIHLANYQEFVAYLNHSKNLIDQIIVPTVHIPKPPPLLQLNQMSTCSIVRKKEVNLELASLKKSELVNELKSFNRSKLKKINFKFI